MQAIREAEAKAKVDGYRTGGGAAVEPCRKLILRSDLQSGNFLMLYRLLAMTLWTADLLCLLKLTNTSAGLEVDSMNRFPVRSRRRTGLSPEDSKEYRHQQRHLSTYRLTSCQEFTQICWHNPEL